MGKMNKHNKQRIIMEKEGEEYRTYTILKALYNLNKAGAGYRNTEGAVIDENEVNATATDMLSFIVGQCKGECGPGKSYNKKKKCSECKADWETCYDFENCPMEKYQKLPKLPITFQELVDNLPSARNTITTKYDLDSGKFVSLRKKRVRTCKKNRRVIYSNGHIKTNMNRRLGEVNTKAMSPSELALRRRRLADAARMEEKDMDDMSPSELALHRRRLAHGAHVSPVLAPLMDEIEQAQRNY